ncbi:hypothetical protein [Acetatifactor muris]
MAESNFQTRSGDAPNSFHSRGAVSCKLA